ncbi:hypothetical protein [Salinithrix halophila]|uniref:DUF2512 family protein n=1 Tax=Salinithrix halophila TaxID=1485204 RepID=A0ABV8JK11_9BACL
MAGLIAKLIICPLVVWISMFLFEGVYYPNWVQPIIVGIILAVLAHFMEVLFLRRGVFWINNSMDFVAAVLVLLFSGTFFEGARVTMTGALLTAFILAVTEYFQHLWLLKSGRTYKGAG